MFVLTKPYLTKPLARIRNTHNREYSLLAFQRDFYSWGRSIILINVKQKRKILKKNVFSLLQTVLAFSIH